MMKNEGSVPLQAPPPPPPPPPKMTPMSLQIEIVHLLAQYLCIWNRMSVHTDNAHLVYRNVTLTVNEHRAQGCIVRSLLLYHMTKITLSSYTYLDIGLSIILKT